VKKEWKVVDNHWLHNQGAKKCIEKKITNFKKKKIKKKIYTTYTSQAPV